MIIVNFLTLIHKRNFAGESSSLKHILRSRDVPCHVSQLTFQNIIVKYMQIFCMIVMAKISQVKLDLLKELCVSVCRQLSSDSPRTSCQIMTSLRDICRRFFDLHIFNICESLKIRSLIKKTSKWYFFTCSFHGETETVRSLFHFHVFSAFVCLHLII